MFGFSLSGSGGPPDSVPLRILGLDVKPTGREAVKAAFTKALFEVHPDLTTYTDPSIRKIWEKRLGEETTVQELVWARDMLYRKIPLPGSGGLSIPKPPKPPTEEERAAQRERERRSRRYGEVCVKCGHEFEADEVAHLTCGWNRRRKLCCADCRGERETDEPIPCLGCGRLVAVEAHLRRYARYPDSFEPTVVCSMRCAGREARLRRRLRQPDPEPIDCEACGERVDVRRADARYCGNACRQKAYRARVKA